MIETEIIIQHNQLLMAPFVIVNCMEIDAKIFFKIFSCDNTGQYLVNAAAYQKKTMCLILLRPLVLNRLACFMYVISDVG